MNRAFRCGVPAGVAVQGARALIFAAFVVLATPAFLYAVAPPLRGVQTALWWSASFILLLCPLLGTRVFDYAQRDSGDDHAAADDDAGDAWPRRAARAPASVRQPRSARHGVLARRTPRRPSVVTH